MPADYLFEACIRNLLEEFVDLEGKKADLDSAEYIDFLNFMNALPDGYKEDYEAEETGVRLQDEKALLSLKTIYSFSDLELMDFAFKGTSCESLAEHLHGTNALAISADDATAPARILNKFAKQYPALEMIAGVVEGNYNDQAGIQALADIPSREELLGKLLGSIQSPITNFARVLSQIAEAGGGEAAIAAKGSGEEAAE